MTLKSLSEKDRPVGVIGAGNFGSVVANLLARHRKVLLYARDEKVVSRILTTGENRGHKMHCNIEPVSDLAYLAKECEVIFPIVPSVHFRSMMKQLSPHLHPYHILIHGTKGLDLTLPPNQTIETMVKLNRSHVKTISEVIQEESVVVRVGCLAGPNLSKELADGHPAATVVS